VKPGGKGRERNGGKGGGGKLQPGAAAEIVVKKKPNMAPAGAKEEKREIRYWVAEVHQAIPVQKKVRAKKQPKGIFLVVVKPGCAV